MISYAEYYGAAANVGKLPKTFSKEEHPRVGDVLWQQYEDWLRK